MKGGELMDKIIKEVESEIYINELIELCNIYNLGDLKDIMKVRHSETKSLLELNVRDYSFENKEYFKMRLLEKVDVSNVSFVDILKYTYHGNYTEEARINFIRFDFEPGTRKYAPLHVNANEEKWGDHLSFPDGTNLDISQMDLKKALKVFSLYSEGKDNYPLDQDTNHEYVDIVKGEDNND